jgi:catechol 2,3-dioxygenase
MDNETNTDFADPGHVELPTPRLEESVEFFVDVLGMTESGREPDEGCECQQNGFVSLPGP